MNKIKNFFDKAFAIENDDEKGTDNSQDQQKRPNKGFSNQVNNNKNTAPVRSIHNSNIDYKNSHKKTPVMKLANTSGAKVHMFQPSGLDDAKTVIEYLNNGYAVLLNLENSDNALSQRIVDVVTGALYLLDGDYSIVTEDIYLFAPKGVEISSPLEAESTKDETIEKNASKSSFKFKK